MKSIQLLFACMLLIIASGCATSRSASDHAATTLSGTWNIEIDTGRGMTVGTLLINREVAGREGSLTTNRGTNVLPVRSLTLDGRAIVLSVESPNGMVLFSGELSRDGQILQGKVNYHDGQVFSMKGVRGPSRGDGAKT